MKGNKGFSLIEMLFAMSITMMLVATVLPIYQTIQLEQHLLKNRLTIQSTLHDLLLEQLFADVMTKEISMSIEHQEVDILFKSQNGHIEGCAQWENEKIKKEMLCLYGIKEE